MASEFKVEIAAAGPEDAETLRVLHRGIDSAKEGAVYESDHRRAVRLVEGLKLNQRPGRHHARDTHIPPGLEGGWGPRSTTVPARGADLMPVPRKRVRSRVPGRKSGEKQNGESIEEHDIGEGIPLEASAGQTGGAGGGGWVRARANPRVSPRI